MYLACNYSLFPYNLDYGINMYLIEEFSLIYSHFNVNKYKSG